MPFVHHPHTQGRQRGLRVGTGEHQGEAFRRGDQRGGQPPGLPRAFAAAGVAGAQANTPRELQVAQRRFQCAGGVRGQGAHGRYPQNRQWFGKRFSFAGFFNRGGRGEAVEGGKPDGVGFAGTRAGVQQPRLPLFDRGPHLFLKGERFPAASGEPVLCEVGGGSHAGGVRSERVLSVTAGECDKFNCFAVVSAIDTLPRGSELARDSGVSVTLCGG